MADLDQLGISTKKAFGGVNPIKIGGKPKKNPVPKTPGAKITNFDHAPGLARGLQRRISSPHSRLSSPRPASTRIARKVGI